MRQYVWQNATISLGPIGIAQATITLNDELWEYHQLLAANSAARALIDDEYLPGPSLYYPQQAGPTLCIHAVYDRFTTWATLASLSYYPEDGIRRVIDADSIVPTFYGITHDILSQHSFCLGFTYGNPDIGMPVSRTMTFEIKNRSPLDPLTVVNYSMGLSDECTSSENSGYGVQNWYPTDGTRYCWGYPTTAIVNPTIRARPIVIPTVRLNTYVSAPSPPSTEVGAHSYGFFIG